MTCIGNDGTNAIAAALVLATIVVVAPAAAEAEATPDAWTAVSVQTRMGAGSPWRWAFDSILRARDGVGTLDLAAERVMVTRDLTQGSRAGVGYAYGAGFPDAASFGEHRFVQQYAWSGGIRRRVSLTSRLEERFVNGDAMRLRLRQQVRITWPLTTRAGLQGVFAEELLVQANSTAEVSRGFDSNRVFVGVARRLTTRSGVEIGYVSLYSRGRSGRNQSSHAISAKLAVSL